MIGSKFKKRVTWPWPCPLRISLSSHLIHSTGIQIWWLSLQPFRRYDCGHRNWNWKWVMRLWPRPFYERFVTSKLRGDVVYPGIKFDDSSFCHSRNIIGSTKFKVGHVTLITPLLRVICHLYAGTWYSLPVQNFTTLASAVSEIWLVPSKFLMVHLTWPRPFQGLFAIMY